MYCTPSVTGVLAHQIFGVYCTPSVTGVLAHHRCASDLVCTAHHCFYSVATEGLPYSPKSVSLLLLNLKAGQSIVRKRGAGRPSTTTQRVKDLIEQMQKDDETTATELDRLLQVKGIKLSHSTILRCRRQLGWTYRGAAYCQLIRELNKLKRLLWCMENQCNDFHVIIMVG